MTVKPRRLMGARPTCEAVVPAAYYRRAYTARDAMREPFSTGYPQGPGHMDGCYCLDRPEPATGGHAAGDFVHRRSS